MSLKALSLSAFLWLCICVSSFAQAVDLNVSGETVLVVKKLPFTVTAQAQKKAFYVWNHPSTVKSEENRNVLTVTAAPAGEITIKVKVVTYDKVADDFVETNGQITIVIGSLPPPGPDPGPGPGPGPGPSPAPETAYQKAVREAYAVETDPEKSSQAKSLATVYAEMAKQIGTQKPSTMGPVWKASEAGAQAAKVNGKLLKVQRVIQEKAWGRLPLKSTDILDNAKRDFIIDVFNETAECLHRLNPKRKEN